ncbi:hypothetical protein [Runella zeae]|jgi:hypothetical protein|uniref:hypothetical protein n=1 Tax=Runella zeae TaxID=94255 RepID=UPI0012F90FF3|nr:hypothetical protein [Runella zeae]
MKSLQKLLSISMLAIAVCVASCSKSEVEPEPADQVIGTYSGTTYTQSISGVGQTLDLTNSLIKDNLVISFDLTKKSSNVLTLILNISQRDSLGVMQPDNITYDNVELKTLSSGSFEMLNEGVRLGEINSKTLTFEESFEDTDEAGNVAEVNIKIEATKNN